MTQTQRNRDAGPPECPPDEKSTLLAFLDYVRASVAAKALGLDDERGRTPGVPSGTSVLGLVKHLTAVEVYWFAWAFDGADVPHPDFGMDVADDESAEGLVAAYRAAVERSNAIVARCDDLERPCARAAGRAGLVRSLRWVLVHMIEETARHAGHADILREQADGATGR
ncbi:DinB family protein [Streptomyces sp. NPDC050504]|uniref:DinB family protein n=1 Tax=Streptomyces sp. NPDC050504 TaxID=3365618 RepID=UPI0037B422AC